MNKRRLFLAAGLSLSLGACGFQPRGQAPAPAAALTPIAVTGIDSDTPLYLTLQRRLGKAMTGDVANAAAVVRISGLQSSSDLLTVGADNKANEYELRESFDFQVRHGDQLSAPQQLTASRLHYAPGTAVLARNREAGELRQALREQLADQLLRRLAAWN